ncbi:Appr-1-p processing domain protein [Xylanimonas cellulosilytica DSM 15894]|uniref:Appr-1-p processing domain protein n=1 Tax=Xylanimonas cellulosilytica (strain DSM 15894 / JCM 12276 / CECT 5975 / KCTC 9989 / LMG 20990 / NBRC 107835 / XIL07) TaxID=446471 RepID=D1BWL7_XYLCX|nr:macro domain-containing protein [Xylanimonas cellulosilytica]ACZ29599.1 Appr-1-p processing domain protein [Xylanimonas cellulosilytica DSM 15894]
MTAASLTLFDLNAALCKAWATAFAGVPAVTVTHTALEDLPAHDVLVTAGNSHAIMDGGLDLAVRDLLGVRVQDAVQWQAATSLGGPIPVGSCVTVPTGHDRFPWLVYAPTMLTPQPIPPSHVLLATLAVLTNRYDDGQTIAIPGLGAGTGGLAPDVVAQTMRTAWDLTGGAA